MKVMAKLELDPNPWPVTLSTPHCPCELQRAWEEEMENPYKNIFKVKTLLRLHLLYLNSFMPLTWFQALDNRLNTVHYIFLLDNTKHQ